MGEDTLSANVPAITVQSTPTMGRGVFAARAIGEGETLGVFYTIHLPPHEIARMAGSTLSHFWFEDDADQSAFIVLGWIELVNHSASPNLDRRWEMTSQGAVVTVFALRDIPSGVQCFIDYKFDARAVNPAWANASQA
jgi:hypothetical protein